MSAFVSLLRGVNVAQCRIKMSELKAAYEQLGFAQVQTYLQSGNVTFETKESSGVLAIRISAAIKKAFGYDVPVLVLSAAKFAEIARANPFPGQAAVDDSFLHLTFLFDEPRKDVPAKLPIAGEEAAELVGRTIYLCCPHGYGRTKLNNTYFERALKTPATTRNWRTVQALVEMTRA